MNLFTLFKVALGNSGNEGSIDELLSCEAGSGLNYQFDQVGEYHRRREQFCDLLPVTAVELEDVGRAGAEDGWPAEGFIVRGGAYYDPVAVEGNRIAEGPRVHVGQELFDLLPAAALQLIDKGRAPQAPYGVIKSGADDGSVAVDVDVPAKRVVRPNPRADELIDLLPLAVDELEDVRRAGQIARSLSRIAPMMAHLPSMATSKQKRSVLSASEAMRRVSWIWAWVAGTRAARKMRLKKQVRRDG